MRQGVIYILILIGGIGIGFLINQFLDTPLKIQTEIETLVVEKIKKQIVRDTVEIEKIIYSPVNTDTFVYEVDDFSDSLTLEEEYNIYIPEVNEEVIIKEELVSQLKIALDAPPMDSTDVSNLLDLKSNAFSNEIIIEFWQSPLNITGYELSRNKLKLFGFNPNETISLQIGNEEDQLFLNTDSMSFILQKTKQFKTLKLK
ncbi:MAG TPA: hypothetical protein VKY37_12810 [Brumimicrobium sp.]|nr:hypothetical protein [Brumimicrobium sp.]